MAIKLKAIAAAVALVAAGQASAALSDGFGGNSNDNGGTLILTVWDSVGLKSYTRDLGIGFNSFLPNSVTTLASDNGTGAGDKTPAGGVAPTPFAGDALFTTTFAGSSAANIKWSIFAYDDAEGAALGLSRLLTTANTVGNVLNAGVRTAVAGLTDFASQLNNSFGCDSAASCAGPAGTGATTQLGFGGFLADGFLGALNGTNVAATGFTESNFFYLATSGISAAGTTSATADRYDNASNVAKFALSADGTVTYSLAADAGVAEVPVPAAAWLLASGLIIGLKSARRRRAAALAA